MKYKKSYVEGIMVAIIVISILFAAFFAIWYYTGKNLDYNFFNVSSSVIIAISTIFYVLLTYFLVKETVLLRRENSRPIVTIDISPSERWINFLDLEVKNIGRGIAYDVKFEILDKNNNPIVKRLNELEFIKNKINYLSPERTIKTFLTSLSSDFDSKIKPFTIKIKYSNSTKRNFEEEFDINIAMLKGTSQMGENPLYKIANNLDDIKREISNIERKIK